jgi:hypothetical protein
VRSLGRGTGASSGCDVLTSCDAHPRPHSFPRAQSALLAAFGLLIASGCVLRFWKLSGVGLWYDELWTVVGASDRPFMEMYREWILGDSHPPGYFLFYFAWLKLVPGTEFWARLPNAIAGVLTVLYLLFRTDRVLNRDERIMSACLASLSYIYIFYALSVKQYSAMVLIVTIATISYLEIVIADRVERRSAISLAAACLALAYLNHFGMVYAAILLLLLAATFRHNREPLQQIARIALACCVGYAPIAYFLYIQVKYSIDGWQPYQLRSFFSDVLPSLFFDDARFVGASLVILVIAVLIRMAAARDARQLVSARRNQHILTIAAVFVGFMVVIGTRKPIFFVRYFLAAVPAVFLGLGILTAAAFPIEKGWPAVLPLAFFVYAAIMQFHTIDALQREAWDQSVDLVLKSKTPVDRVYILGSPVNKTEFDYLKAGDVDGVFYVRNLKFYRYYFRRRDAAALAAKLEVIAPTIQSASALAAKFRNTGITVYVLAGHHLEYRREALAMLEHAARQIAVTRLNSTLIYKLRF